MIVTGTRGRSLPWRQCSAAPPRASCTTRTAQCSWCRTTDGGAPGSCARPTSRGSCSSGDRAYKLKKPLRLPFLDYGTLERRHHLCREEVRLNRRLAPDVYLGVRALVRVRRRRAARRPRTRQARSSTRSRCGATTRAPRSRAGSTPARPGRTRSRRSGRRIAAFHAGAGRPARSRASGRGVRGDAERELRDPARAAMPIRRTGSTTTPSGSPRPCSPVAGDELLPARRAGLVRDGHGDLRAEHVVLERGIEIVDCVEFDPALREIDVGLDLAFLVMDLLRRDERLAAALVSAYREAGGDPGDDALVDVLRRAAGADPREGRARARGPGRRRRRRAPAGGRRRRCSRSPERLGWRVRIGPAAIVCGAAASGKSTLAAAIGERAGATRAVVRPRPQGARWVSRRRRGRPRAPTGRPSTAGPTRRSGARARELIGAGERVVVDATFRFARRPARRSVAALGAAEPHVARVPRPGRGARAAGRRAAAREPAASRTQAPTSRSCQAEEWQPLGEVPAHRRSHRSRPGQSVLAALRDGLDARLARSSRRTTQRDGWSGPDGAGRRRPVRSAFMPAARPHRRRRAARRRHRPRPPDGRRATSPSCARCSTGCRSSRAGCASSAPAPTSHRAALVHGRARAGARPRARRRRRRRRSGSSPTPRTCARRPAARRGRVRGRRRLAGPRDRHGAARAPVRARDRRRHRRRSPPRCSRTNRRMIQVFRDSGFAVEVESRAGRAADRASRPRSATRRARASRSATRSPPRRPSRTCCGPRRSRSSARRAARARSARRCCATCARPASSGRLSVVHPREATVGGLPAHRSIADVPGARRAGRRSRSRPRPSCDVARECGAAGVRALVVLSAGFAEVGRRGRDRQAELLAVCRASGMRLVGPNCLGVLNTAPDVGSERDVRAGRAARRAASRSPPRAARSASRRSPRPRAAGSACPRSCRPATRPTSPATTSCASGRTTPTPTSIGLYLESFGNPRRFGQIARRVAARKPVDRGQERALGGRRARRRRRTPARCSPPPTRRSTRCSAHAGVIRTGTVGELFDVAALLAGQPLPRGNRVGDRDQRRRPRHRLRRRLRGGRAAGRAAADQDAPPARDGTCRARRRTANPVDMIASASRRRLPARDRGASPTTRPSTPSSRSSSRRSSRRRRTSPSAVRAAAAATRGGRQAAARRLDGAGRRRARRRSPAASAASPPTARPEEAVRALAHAAGYARWRRDRRRSRRSCPTASTPTPPPATIAEALAEGGGWLVPDRVAELLAAYGVPQVAATRRGHARRRGALRRRARRTGRGQGDRARAACTSPTPAASGSASAARAAAGRAAREIAAAVREAGHQPVGFLVQAMAPEGVEMLVGVASDPDLGPGRRVRRRRPRRRAARRRAVAPGPAEPPRRRARCCASLRTFPLLDGYRGAPRADVAALEDVARADRRARRRAPRDRRARLQPGARRARRARPWSTRASGSRRRGRRGPIRRSTGEPS